MSSESPCLAVKWGNLRLFVLLWLRAGSTVLAPCLQMCCCVGIWCCGLIFVTKAMLLGGLQSCAFQALTKRCKTLSKVKNPFRAIKIKVSNWSLSVIIPEGCSTGSSVASLKCCFEHCCSAQGCLQGILCCVCILHHCILLERGPSATSAAEWGVVRLSAECEFSLASAGIWVFHRQCPVRCWTQWLLSEFQKWTVGNEAKIFLCYYPDRC